MRLAVKVKEVWDWEKKQARLFVEAAQETDVAKLAWLKEKLGFDEAFEGSWLDFQKAVEKIYEEPQRIEIELTASGWKATLHYRGETVELHAPTYDLIMELIDQEGIRPVYVYPAP